MGNCFVCAEFVSAFTVYFDDLSDFNGVFIPILFLIWMTFLICVLFISLLFSLIISPFGSLNISLASVFYHIISLSVV